MNKFLADILNLTNKIHNYPFLATEAERARQAQTIFEQLRQYHELDIAPSDVRTWLDGLSF